MTLIGQTIRKLTRMFSTEPAPVALPPVPPEAVATTAIAEVRAAQLTYCGRPKLENLAAAAIEVERAGIDGAFVEAGVALGGSAIVLARLKNRRRLYLYDVYGMIPPPGPDDGEDAHKRYSEIASGSSKGLGENVYYGYVDDLITTVVNNLRRFGVDPERHDVTLVTGRFEDSLHPVEPIALAHIDCDWYNSVMVCIERIAPHLVPGGMVAFDDYSSFSGCRRAVDEWLASDSRLEVWRSERSIVVRKVV